MAQNSLLQSPPTLSEEQLALRDQLAEYNAAALELGHRINALSLPSKLPPEILSRSFLTTATLVRESTLSHMLRAANSRWTCSYYEWVRVAHVCQYWRNVALGCSALWAFLAFEAHHPSDDAHRKCLERAGDCPLTVFYHQNFGNACDLCRRSDCVDEVGLGEIERLLPHIRDLVVVVETDFAMETLWDTLSEPAISLEIALRGEAYSGYVGGVLLHPTFDLPDELFASTIPRLQSLAVASVSFSWLHSLFSPSLRHLEITDRRGVVADLDMAMFLSVLQTLPHLERLIATSLPKVTSIELNTASLPTLRHPCHVFDAEGDALSVSGSTPSNRPWSEMFSCAPNVSLLRVTGRAGYLLGSWLGRPGAPVARESEDGARNPGQPGAGEAIMPRLQTIQLVKVHFPPPREPEDFKYPYDCCCEWCEFSDGKWGKRGIDVQDLVKGLWRRRQLGTSEIKGSSSRTVNT
ncbi:hypothetical protein LXA43DRAFT_1096771 [Ganoderma leucocontextum]|nr:hypothetical protein LXA43DRAFT_1096771 [Ganoderma leucocontextum]